MIKSNEEYNRFLESYNQLDEKLKNFNKMGWDEQEILLDFIIQVIETSSGLDGRATLRKVLASQFPSQGLKELLDDVDFELAHLEDFTHGEHGKTITQLRKRVSEMQKQTKTSTPDGSQGLREALEKFVQAVKNAPVEWLPTVELNDAYDLATEALKK